MLTMTRDITMTELAERAGLHTTASLATALGKHVGTVYHWAQHGKLPEPDYVYQKYTRLWEPDTIEQWAESVGERLR